MTTRVCAVCGKVKSICKFGNGITVPKTTCLACKAIEFAEIKTVIVIKRIIRGIE
jgi:hypothetical protein